MYCTIPLPDRNAMSYFQVIHLGGQTVLRLIMIYVSSRSFPQSMYQRHHWISSRCYVPISIAAGFRNPLRSPLSATQTLKLAVVADVIKKFGRK